jgi:hypothetical protein
MIYVEYQRQIPGHFGKYLIDIRAVEVKIKKELNANDDLTMRTMMILQLNILN